MSKQDTLDMREVVGWLGTAIGEVERRLRDQITEMTRQEERQAVGRAAPDRVRPLPAARVGKFIRAAGTAEGVPAGTPLYPRPGAGGACAWRTSFACSLTGWNVEEVEEIATESLPWIRAGERTTSRGLRVRLLRRDPRGPSALRVFLDGPCGHRLYAALIRYCRGVVVRSVSGAGDAFGRGGVRALGLDAGESLAPAHPSAPWEWSLLRELAHFPQKFLFVEFAGLPAEGVEAELVVMLDEGSPDLREVKPRDLVTDAAVIVSLESRLYPLSAVEAGVERAEVPAPPGLAVFSVDGLSEIAASGPRREIPHESAAGGRVGWRYWHAEAEGERGGPRAVVTLPPSESGGEYRTLNVRYTAMAWDRVESGPLTTEDAAVRCEVLAGNEAGPAAQAPMALASWCDLVRRLTRVQSSGGRLMLGDLLRAEAAPASARHEGRGRRDRAIDVASAVIGAHAEPARLLVSDGAGREAVVHGRSVRIQLDAGKLPEGRGEVVGAVLAEFLRSLAPLGTFVAVTVVTSDDEEGMTWPAR